MKSKHQIFVIERFFTTLNNNYQLVCISTSKRVLRMPFAGQNTQQPMYADARTTPTRVDFLNFFVSYAQLLRSFLRRRACFAPCCRAFSMICAVDPTFMKSTLSKPVLQSRVSQPFIIWGSKNVFSTKTQFFVSGHSNFLLERQNLVRPFNLDWQRQHTRDTWSKNSCQHHFAGHSDQVDGKIENGFRTQPVRTLRDYLSKERCKRPLINYVALNN